VTSPVPTPADQARFIREQLPPDGLFAGQDWRIAPDPFLLPAQLAREIETLGRVLLQFYRSVNLLYRQSAAGKQPAWVADWLDRGKPIELIELQRAPALKNELPRVIRPDLLITDTGLTITELDSVPGGIGLTAWLNQTYQKSRSMFRGHSAKLSEPPSSATLSSPGSGILGGEEGMMRGFASIFGDAKTVHIVVSEEAATYRPEMAWLSSQLGTSRFRVQNGKFAEASPGEAVYRFFELFDLANVPGARALFRLAVE
jgi:hypothetical protein